MSRQFGLGYHKGVSDTLNSLPPPPPPEIRIIEKVVVAPRPTLGKAIMGGVAAHIGHTIGTELGTLIGNKLFGTKK